MRVHSFWDWHSMPAPVPVVQWTANDEQPTTYKWTNGTGQKCKVYIYAACLFFLICCHSCPSINVRYIWKTHHTHNTKNKPTKLYWKKEHKNETAWHEEHNGTSRTWSNKADQGVSARAQKPQMLQASNKQIKQYNTGHHIGNIRQGLTIFRWSAYTSFLVSCMSTFVT
jgi:hypothetical protein